MIILETIKVKKRFFNFKHPKSYMYLAIGVGFFAMLIIIFNHKYLNFKEVSSIFYPLFGLAVILYFISGILNNFSKEDVEIIKTGKIKISTESFLIDKLEIPFFEIVKLTLVTQDYEGNTKYSGSSFNSMFSAGVDNYIAIATKNQKFKKKVLINSYREIHLLHDFISNQIIKDKFPIVDPKILIAIFTDDFKRTEEARNYIATQIKNY